MHLRAPKEPVHRGELDKSGLRLLTHNGAVVVFQASKDGPAFAAVLRDKDILTAPDGHPVNAKDIWIVRNRLRGQPGEEVELQYRRGNEESFARFELGADEIP